MTGLAGKKVLITAGPCREAIDPVRYISNRSSGKMGYALARAASAAGASVTLISGPTNLNTPPGVTRISVETTAEMHAAVSEHFDSTDCLIMAAAPADYRPARPANQKIKKAGADLSLALEPTDDILKEMGQRRKPGQILVGFALETDNGEANARAKLSAKNLDLIVLNNPRDKNSAFDHDTNKVSLITAVNSEDLPLLSKDEVATLILGKIISLLA